MTDPRPGAVDAGARWPLLAVLIEYTTSGARLTFAVSDVAPDTDVGPVVLGVDQLTGDDDSTVTLSARFRQGGVEVVTTRNGVATVEEDARVEYLNGAVVVTAGLPPAPDTGGRGPVGFCSLAGVPHQVDVPVLVLSATAS